MFDQLAEHCGPAKWTHKINYYQYINREGLCARCFLQDGAMLTTSYVSFYSWPHIGSGHF